MAVSHENLTGQHFGRWVVIGYAPKHGPKLYWRVRCACGEERQVSGNTLRTGTSKSCGCLKKEAASRTFTIHGMCHSREYASWQTAKERCHNRRNPNYRYYGARGIAMCQAWRNSFEQFYADMGQRPEGTSLDRIDNDGPYAPENCRWATRAEQGHNKRSNHRVIYQGQTHTLTQWAALRGLTLRAVSHRISRGWTVERALNQPLQHKGP